MLNTLEKLGFVKIARGKWFDERTMVFVVDSKKYGGWAMFHGGMSLLSGEDILKDPENNCVSADVAIECLEKYYKDFEEGKIQWPKE